MKKKLYVFFNHNNNNNKYYQQELILLKQPCTIMIKASLTYIVDSIKRLTSLNPGYLCYTFLFYLTIYLKSMKNQRNASTWEYMRMRTDLLEHLKSYNDVDFKNVLYIDVVIYIIFISYI